MKREYTFEIYADSRVTHERFKIIRTVRASDDLEAFTWLSREAVYQDLNYDQNISLYMQSKEIRA